MPEEKEPPAPQPVPTQTPTRPEPARVPRWDQSDSELWKYVKEVTNPPPNPTEKK